MAGLWDSNLKQLVGANPEHFVFWLLPEAKYVRELSGHLTRSLDVDILYEVSLDGQRVLFHLEFQRYDDATMAERVWEYNVLASRKFQCVVLSSVLYLKQEGPIVESPFVQSLPNGEEIHRFTFRNIKLWEVPTAELRRTGLLGLLPLLPLTREGAKQAVVEEEISEIQQQIADQDKQARLLSITLTLASLAFDSREDRTWLRRRFQMLHDLLRDTEIYQLIVQEGREEGLQLGLKQGEEKGIQLGRKEGEEKGLQLGREEGIQEARKEELQRQHQLLLHFVQARFPRLVRLATKQVSVVTDREILDDLIYKIGLAQLTEEEARQLFLDLDSEEE